MSLNTLYETPSIFVLHLKIGIQNLRTYKQESSAISISARPEIMLGLIFVLITCNKHNLNTINTIKTRTPEKQHTIKR